MCKQILLILILFIFNITNAQKITWGPEYERDENNKAISLKTFMEKKILSYDASGFYMLGVENRSNALVSLFPVLEKYDNQLNRIYSEKLGTLKQDGSLNPFDLVIDEDAFFINIINQKPLLTFRSSSGDKVSIASLSINEKGLPEKPEKTLLSFPEGKKVYYGWDVKPNSEKTTLGIFAYSFATKTDFAFIQYKTIDEKSNILSEQSFQTKYVQSSIEFITFCIHNNNLHILAKIYSGKNEVYKLLSYYAQDQKLIETDVNIPLTSIYDISFFPTKNETPIVCGFSSLGDKGATDFFTLKAGNSSTEINKIITKSFDNGLLSEVLTEKRIQKKPFIDNLLIRNFIETEDNSYIVLAEQFNGDVKDYASMKENTTKTAHGSILAIKTDLSGNVKWWHGFYKEQVRTVSFGSMPGSSLGMQSAARAHESYGQLTGVDYTPFYSFTYVYKNNVLTLLYNDNIKNGTSTNIEEMKRADEDTENLPVAVTLPANGAYKKELYALDDQYKFRPKLSFYSNKTGLIVFKREKKIFSFGRVKGF